MKKLWLLLGIVVILGFVTCQKEPETGAIAINSTPTGATVYLDGTSTSKTTNVVLDSIEPGDHTVKLTLEGYDDYEDTVTVTEGDTVTVNATLVANAFGTLDISSTPAGAEIWIDNTNTGAVTDTILDSIPAGSHTLKLVLANYNDLDTTFTITKDETTVMALTMNMKTGSIQVNSDPDGATIWLDDVSTGYVTDYLLTDVPVGDHIIKLVLDGYKDWLDTVTVSDAATETVDATLEAAPKEEVTLKYDEASPVGFGFKLDAGNKVAVKMTPPSYPFEITEAAYVPMGWADDPDNWDEACYLVFLGDGTEPGAELGRKEVSGTVSFDFNWFDVSDLDITINSGSFYFAVENKVNDNPGLALDGGKPLNHVSWLYVVYVGETDPRWAPFDSIDAGIGVALGDSVDAMLRVKGLVPGNKEVVLTPTIVKHNSYSIPSVTLPTGRKYEILDWRKIR